MRYFVGIDNGVSGSFAVLEENKNVLYFDKTPIKKELHWTKTKQFVNRVNHREVKKILKPFKSNNIIAVLERPFTDPTKWKASVSAVRAFESTCVVLEQLEIPYCIIDSREWQKEMLPSGIKGSKELKEASLLVGKKLFPKVKINHSDCDGLLICEWSRRKGL